MKPWHWKPVKALASDTRYAMASDTRYAFDVSWFDPVASMTRKYQLIYYASDGTIEMVRLYTHTPFRCHRLLLRTRCPLHHDVPSPPSTREKVFRRHHGRHTAPLPPALPPGHPHSTRTPPPALTHESAAAFRSTTSRTAAPSSSVATTRRSRSRTCISVE